MLWARIQELCPRWHDPLELKEMKLQVTWQCESDLLRPDRLLLDVNGLRLILGYLMILVAFVTFQVK